MRSGSNWFFCMWISIIPAPSLFTLHWITSVPLSNHGCMDLLLHSHFCSIALYVYQFTRAAITNYHRLDGLNNGNLFSNNLEARSARSNCSLVWFLLSLSSWLADHCLFTLSSHGLLSVCTHAWCFFQGWRRMVSFWRHQSYWISSPL